MRAIRRFTVRTVLPESLSALAELATNLRWSWHAPTRQLFEDMNPQSWATIGEDPVALLSTLTPQRLAEFAQDPQFVARVNATASDLHQYLTEPRWYQQQERELPASIAYFSPEFGIAAALPQYSGGLGILAGDHLKTASDLGVPIVGVGLLYQHGYFNQSISNEGWQQESYPVLDPDELPLSLLREEDGTPSRIEIGLPGGRILYAHIWKAQVGRVPLLLLDSQVEANDEACRGVTDRLYGGGSEHRLQQEMLLGIGGVRALRIWSRLSGDPDPEVFHSNEGHAGFLNLERMRELTQNGVSYDAAFEMVRAGTIFTTHTPVPAGIDRFSNELISTYFGGDNAVPGLPIDRILELGSEDYPGGIPDAFNMAVMGLRLGQHANGVSKLHGVVSREMFDGLWPGFDAAEVPITSITNGVHAPTWRDALMTELAEKHLGPSEPGTAERWEFVDQIPDTDLWEVRKTLRTRLVEDARKRLCTSWKQRGSNDTQLRWVNDALDPEVLTIGFARRVPTYKRLTLMLRDPDRLRALLLDPKRPIQLIIAGKSHPDDDPGKRLLQKLVRFADDPAVRHRIAFLPNYDIDMAQTLLPGCDVWLNNPLRPFEACGTSGMKSALNGGLNLSILDGWWDELYDGENGWAIPTADGVDDPDSRDDQEAAALYDIIEGLIIPRFYDRDSRGIPVRWLELVRHTLSSLTPQVMASRMLIDYVNELYVPAADHARPLTPEIAGHNWSTKARIREHWDDVRVEHVESEGVSDIAQIGDSFTVRAFVSLGNLKPEDVKVQLISGRVTPSDTLLEASIEELELAESYDGGRCRFEDSITLNHTGAFGYTVRVLPNAPGTVNDAEMGLVANAEA